MISCVPTNASGEIAQRLRVPAALPEHPCLLPSTYMVTHNHLQFQLQEAQTCRVKSLKEDSQLLDQMTDSYGTLRHVCGIYIL